MEGCLSSNNNTDTHSNNNNNNNSNNNNSNNNSNNNNNNVVEDNYVMDECSGSISMNGTKSNNTYNVENMKKNGIENYSINGLKKNTKNKITIIAYGSLMSKKSAVHTMKSATNFRVGILNGFIRFFYPAYDFIPRKLASLEKRDIGTLAVFPSSSLDMYGVKVPSKEIQVALFDIDEGEDFEKFKIRETGYNIVTVKVFDSSGRGEIEAVMAQGRDFGQIQKHSPFYPCSVYVRHCVISAQKWGEKFEENFLSTTYLFNQTPLSAYMSENEWVLHVKVPPDVSERYNG